MLKMGRLFTVTAILAFVLLSYPTPDLLAVNTVIKGKVAGIVGGRVKISYDGPYAPNVGDPTEIGFEVGNDFIPVEGEWKIVEVGSEFVWAVAQGAGGGVPSPDYLVVIHAMNPLQRSALPPSTKIGDKVGASRDRGITPDADGNVLIYDAFDDNRHGWAVWENGNLYDACFENGTYVIETKNDLLSRETIKPSFRMPEKFRLEVTSTWKKGVDNEMYGLLLGATKNSYYLFAVSGNGQAVVAMIREGEPMPDPIPWQVNSASVGNGSSSNHLWIDVKGDDITFYVNNKRIGTIKNSFIKDDWVIGVAVSAQQRIAFDDLRLTVIE